MRVVPSTLSADAHALAVSLTCYTAILASFKAHHLTRRKRKAKCRAAQDSLADRRAEHVEGAPTEAVPLRAAACDKSPHQQDEHCAHDASDEACPLTSLIPAEGLSEVGGDQGADNAEGCGENEALGLVRAARRDEFGNHSGNKHSYWIAVRPDYSERYSRPNSAHPGFRDEKFRSPTVPRSERSFGARSTCLET